MSRTSQESLRDLRQHPGMWRMGLELGWKVAEMTFQVGAVA